MQRINKGTDEIEGVKVNSPKVGISRSQKPCSSKDESSSFHITSASQNDIRTLPSLRSHQSNLLLDHQKPYEQDFNTSASRKMTDIGETQFKYDNRRSSSLQN